MNITAHLLLPTLAPACRRAGIGRAALKRAYTWHYSTQGLPMCCIAAKHCELLPHIFTIACRSIDEGRLHQLRTFAFAKSYGGKAVIFCGTISFPPEAESRLFAGELLFAVRTFLSFARAIVRVCRIAKLSIIPLKLKERNRNF